MTELPAYTSPFEKTDDNTSLLQSATWKVMEQPLNVIYYGPPGTGKTHRVQGIIERMRKDGEREDDFYRFVTFHPSYAYEDFVEGIRPGVTENGQVDYSVKDGVFKELCNQARENPTQPYVMVIDEINRGNISSIFGELITLIEQSKREFMPGGLSVTLPYSQEKFSVPANVFIYGTMNTADRSLTLIDTALRRRFEFVEVSPDPALLDKLMVPGASKEKPINIRRMLEEMNRRLELLYDHDHTIGHAYFTELCKLREDMRFERLSRIMEKKIIPLLEEYFFDDLKKAAIVLGDNRKSDRDCRFLITGSTAEDREILDEAGRSVHATCKRNAKALNNPDAYIGIYETSGAEGQKKA